jgi:hypothetical protein
MPTVQQQVTHVVKTNGTTEVEVTAADGTKYEIKLALLIPIVIDTGMVNPIDNVPIFNIPANIVAQITRKT